ncbi:hypothetical protein ACHAWF_010252 [Thalassiosira exigua]
MRSDRLSDTVHFHHNEITTTTLTHVDELMRAITDCTAAIKDLGSSQTTPQMHDLQRLFAATTVRAVSNAETMAAPTDAQPAPLNPDASSQTFTQTPPRLEAHAIAAPFHESYEIKAHTPSPEGAHAYSSESEDAQAHPSTTSAH